MSIDNFKDFDDDSRLWVYGFDRSLSQDEEAQIQSKLNEFIASWKSHGKGLHGAGAILESTFVALVNNDESPSGCSIDKSVGALREFAGVLNLKILGGDFIFLKKDGKIQALKRSRFISRFRQGEVNSQTPVFDTTLQKLGDLRTGLFEKNLCDSWQNELVK